MKRYRFSSLRVRLQMLVWVAIIPVLLLVVSENILDRSRKEAEIMGEAVSLVNLAKGGLEQHITNTRSLLFATSHADVMQKGGPASMSAFLKNIHEHYPEYLNFGAVDLQGNVFASAVPLKRPVNASDLYYFRQALKSRSFTVGEYQMGRITGLEIVIFGQPVFDSAGRMKFLLFASMDVKWLNSLWEHIKLLPDSTFTVTDNSGIVLFRYPLAPDTWVGKNMSHVPIVRTMLAVGKGISETEGLDNKSRIHAFTMTDTPGSKIHMTVGVSKKEASKTINNMLLTGLLSLIVITLCGIFLSRVFTDRYIMKPINALRDATVRFASGDYSSRINVSDGENEIIAFAKVFDKMAETIQKNTKDLRLFRELIDKSNDAIFIADAETGRILDVNEKACTSTGYSREELLTMHIMAVDAVATEYSLWKEHVEEVRKKGYAVFESAHKRKDGATFPVEINTKYLEVDEHSYILGIARDIAERMYAEKTLQESEEFVNSIVENIPNMIFVKDAGELRFVMFNKAGEELLGYQREDLYGKNDYDFFPREEAEFFTAKDRDVLNSKKIVDIPEETIETRHKGKRVLHTTKVPIMDAQGNPKFLLGIAQDITELKKVEEKIHILATLVDIAPASITVHDLDGNYLYANQTALDLHGYSKEEFFALNIHEIDVPEDARLIASRIQRIAENNQTSFEVSHYRKDRSILQLYLFAKLTEWGGRKVVLSVASDITERNKAQQALQKSEAFVRNILQSVGEGIVVIDPEYRIITANRAYCEQLKVKLEDIIGKHCYEVSHHITKPCFTLGEVCAPMHTFKTGEPTLSVHTHYDAENNPVMLEARSFPMKDASGRITAVIETLNNITDQKKLEDQLRQAQKMEAVGTLAGGVAHDFNNILSAIIGYAHISLMKMKPEDPVRHNIDQILVGSQRAAALTQSLLSFSRKQVINPVLLDLNALLQRFEKFVMRLIREDIEFTCRCSAGALPIMADGGQLEQAIMNLVTNARDAMPEGGRLLIETERTQLGKDFIDAHGYGVPGEFALLSITDTGGGMDETKKAHIFEPFFTTKEQGKGTGLGLSMVYGIVKQHDGFINAFSEPGKGTAFRIYLPISPVKAAPEEAHKEEPVPSLEGTETILLAEDDEPVRRLTRTVLENFGYTVIEAADGEDAINKFIANKDRIQLALLDAIMPKKNGGEVFRELAALKPGLPVLFMSGYPAEIMGKQGILEPGTTFVPKPISPSELLKKVREALGK